MSERIERLAAACLLPSFPGTDVPDWMRKTAMVMTMEMALESRLS